MSVRRDGRRGGAATTGATPAQVIRDKMALVEAQKRFLRNRGDAVVMFVDLVGSTAYKEAHPDEADWLPRLAEFLTEVSKIVSAQGRVVKYIGDEVMAVFEDPDAALHAEHAAEEIVAFCRRSSSMFKSKIALDYGPVYWLKFGTKDYEGAGRLEIAGDPQGRTVDRCARIASKARGQIVLASSAFHAKSPDTKRWRRVAKLQVRGIQLAFDVFALKTTDVDGGSVVQTTLSVEEATARIAELERMVDELKTLNMRSK